MRMKRKCGSHQGQRRKLANRKRRARHATAGLDGKTRLQSPAGPRARHVRFFQAACTRLLDESPAGPHARYFVHCLIGIPSRGPRQDPDVRGGRNVLRWHL